MHLLPRAHLEAVLMKYEASEHATPEYIQPVLDDRSTWAWPAAATFTDDSIARHALQTCSQRGSQRIRLIRIRPGNSQDVIQCETKVCFLSGAGDYVALSYMWGAPTSRHWVRVDGQPRAIMKNLWRFLLQAKELRTRFSAWLWVDAMSIDQTDLWEKLEQVKKMYKIFASASRVIVWLGPAYSNSNVAMELLADLSREKPNRTSLLAVWAPSIWPALLSLCDRPYWRRTWVFQELRAATRVDLMCGGHIVGLPLFKKLLFGDNTNERSKDVIHYFRFSPAAEMMNLTEANLYTSLRALLDSTAALRCLDVRDRVYAILNVASSSNENIEADYTLTLPEILKTVLRNSVGRTMLTAT